MSLDYDASISGSITYGANGTSVVITDSYIISGAPEAFQSPVQGLVYIYNRSDYTLAYTIASPDDIDIYIDFATAIAATDNVIVVGAYSANYDEGKVYVYRYANSEWSLSQTISSVSSVFDNKAKFGSSVSISGSYLIVGAYSHSDELGGFAIYKDNGTSYTISNDNAITGSVAASHFGQSVKLMDDSTALVGAPYEPIDGQVRVGKVYVYTRSSETWSLSTTITKPTLDNSKFGMAIDSYGDSVVIGASGTNALTAYYYTRSGSSWSSGTELEIPDNTSYSTLGESVAIYGNYILVGRKTTGAASIMPVFLFYINNGNLEYRGSYSSPYSGTDQSAYGYSLAIGSDIAVISAMRENSTDGTNDAGNLYIYELVAMSTGSGDPHVKPILGKPYYLPHTDDTFLMYTNNNEDYPVTIKAKCWFLPREKYAYKLERLIQNGYMKRAEKYEKLFENATYFKYVEIVCGGDRVIVDMDGLRLCRFTTLHDVHNYVLPTIKNYTNQSIINVDKIKKSNSNIYGQIKGNNGSYERVVVIKDGKKKITLKLKYDPKDTINRNSMELKINRMQNSDYGALIQKHIEVTEFGSNYNNYHQASIRPLKYNVMAQSEPMTHDSSAFIDYSEPVQAVEYTMTESVEDAAHVYPVNPVEYNI